LQCVGFVPATPESDTIRTFTAVTDCHATWYAEHGRRMVETFVQHWPTEVLLVLYAEGFRLKPTPGRAEARGDLTWDIAEGIGHRASPVLINSSLGEFMDHIKGNRKEAGVSRADDLIVKRDEAYWQQMKPPQSNRDRR
jgi:hypothetical protein